MEMPLIVRSFLAFSRSAEYNIPRAKGAGICFVVVCALLHISIVPCVYVLGLVFVITSNRDVDRVDLCTHLFIVDR